jgi:DHA1 family inner membrane transport protein
MPLSLLALFFAAFAYGTTEFVIAGILPEVAAGLDVTVPSAGYLVSGYALGVALGGPVLTLTTAHVPRKTLLMGLLAGFSAGQLACALAPDFTSMLAFRFVTAITHGCYFGVAMVVAVSLVPPDRRGRAIALILAGLTVSNIVGVPIGAAIGGAFGWRSTFWAMFGLGVLGMALIGLLVPHGVGPAHQPGNLGREFRTLGRQQVWTSLVLILMLMIAQMMPYTYIAPLLHEVTGLVDQTIPIVLLIIGVGSTFGVFVGGRLADWRLMPSLIALLALQAMMMALMYLAAPYPEAMIAVLTVWGALNFAIGAPVQTRILSWTADAPNLASALIPSGFNLGIAIAASLGAVLLNNGLPYRSIPLLGVASMTIATLVALASLLAERRAGRAAPLTMQNTA